MLQQHLQPRALDNGLRHCPQRISQRLNFFVLGVVELTIASTLRSAVTEFFPSLKGHFKVAIAIQFGPIAVAGHKEDALDEFRAQPNIAVHIRSLEALRPFRGQLPALGLKVPAAIGMNRQRPMRGREPRMGKIHTEDRGRSGAGLGVCGQ